MRRAGAFALLALAAIGGHALAQSSAIAMLPAPFQRIGGAFAFPVSTTPQTYAIAEPFGATSYRGVNTCTVDVAIATVTATQPVTTQPAMLNGQTIANVQQVTSQTGTVDPFAGTLFLARTSETLGSTKNPMAGAVRYVSIVALTAPATPCAFRLGYGNGG